jgi:hypothetical protein
MTVRTFPSPRRTGIHPGAALLTLALLGLAVTLGCSSSPFFKSIAVPTGPEPTPPLLQAAPNKYSLRMGPFLFLSDSKLPPNHPVFDDLAGLRDQVTRELKLPQPAALVQVYLFEERDRYEQFMAKNYPRLPQRRAFFVAQPRFAGAAEELLVYAYLGERIQQDLRHELTHALLHSVLKGVPMWLDEGIAEFFETPSANDGLNPEHLRRLRAENASPNLARLEGLNEVRDMNPAEYREAWAWVHLMLRGRPEARNVLLQYVRELRTNPQPGPLRSRLVAVWPRPEEALAEHLARLEQAHLASGAAPRGVE